MAETERGLASYYADSLHGNKTASGESYDKNAMTAAHRSLEFGTLVVVTYVKTGKSVEVRVNDRGPFHADRLIDLSYGAAVKLGYMQRGTASVEVTVLNIAGVDDLRDVPGGHYRFLQLGAYSAESAALSLQSELQAFLQVPVFVNEVDAGGKRLYRVRIGPVADAGQMELVQQQLADGGYSAGQPLP